MPAGRPKKLTPEIRAQICEQLRRGLYVETVAHLVGVDKTVIYDELRAGARAKDADSIEFSHAVKKALSEGEQKLLSYIDGAAASGDWQAAAWRLQRRFPGRYGKRAEDPKMAKILYEKLRAETELAKARAEEAQRSDGTAQTLEVVLKSFEEVKANTTDE